tara:strand:+ start:1942 stop:2964 length:1023 start_codon:yes stop_codon:yes gene_type:complete
MQNKNFIRKKITPIDVVHLAKAIQSGNFIALSRGITLCESKKQADRELANKLVKLCLPLSGNSIRIGITGVPGVGKSTFIENFGIHLIKNTKKKVAVLAVDPSSSKTKGSILGDKTRMEKLSTNPHAYIRPSPSSGSLGGVANQTRETIILCEAAGFEIIIVETVGVGQSETEVKEMTDFFLLLMLAGAGDELQGIKKGIMEMADGLLINKADGENVLNAKKARREYSNAFHLFSMSESGWTPQVDLCSALESINMDSAWKMVQDYITHTKDNGFFEKQRKKQLRFWFLKTIDELMHNSFYNSASLKGHLKELESKVEAKSISPFEAASEIFEAFKKSIK